MGYFDHEGTYWPENRLTSRLAEIRELNRDFGVRASGGGVPTEVLLEHKGVAVITPEQAAERDAAWAAEQAGPASVPEAPTVPVMQALPFAVDPAGPMTVLCITIDPPTIQTNKGAFPISTDEAKFFKRKALGVVIASLTAAMEDADDPTGTSTPEALAV